MGIPDAASQGEILSRADLEARVSEVSRDIYTKAYDLIVSNTGYIPTSGFANNISRAKGDKIVAISAYQKIPEILLFDDNASLAERDNCLGTVYIQVSNANGEWNMPRSVTSITRYLIEPRKLEESNKLSRSKKTVTIEEIGDIWNRAQTDVTVGAFASMLPDDGYDDLTNNPSMPEGWSDEELKTRLAYLQKISELLD